MLSIAFEIDLRLEIIMHSAKQKFEISVSKYKSHTIIYFYLI